MMKVIGLNSIHREDSCLYYRRKFTADAKLDILANTVVTTIAFCIETGPLGDRTIEIDLPRDEDLNYPIIPITSALKQYILTLDSEGTLP
jgi:hypothetical protein